MAASKTVSPGRLLTQVTGERQTGVLVVGGHPGGTVYVLEGRVIYAESPAAPGVGELLTASGRLAGRTWQTALDLGTSTARVGPLLIEQGHLTRGELEMCVLGAIYDAAYFVLSPASAPVDFLPGATHWLGPVVHVDPEAVIREVARRARILDAIFPDARVDTMAIAPAARPPRERITLTALQWELLVHADGQRTPADLALLLGKAGYACVQELRRMAAAGLLELPETPAPGPEFVRLPRARGTAVDVNRPVPDQPVPGRPAPDLALSEHGLSRHGPSEPGLSEHGLSARALNEPGLNQRALNAQALNEQALNERALNERPETAPAVPVVAAARAAVPAPTAAPPPDPLPAPTLEPDKPPRPRHSIADDNAPTQALSRPPRLARRKPGAKLPKEVAGEPPPVHPGTDEVLLKRIRTALRALR